MEKVKKCCPAQGHCSVVLISMDVSSILLTPPSTGNPQDFKVECSGIWVGHFQRPCHASDLDFVVNFYP